MTFEEWFRDRFGLRVESVDPDEEFTLDDLRNAYERTPKS